MGADAYKKQKRGGFRRPSEVTEDADYCSNRKADCGSEFA